MWPFLLICEGEKEGGRREERERERGQEGGLKRGLEGKVGGCGKNIPFFLFFPSSEGCHFG